MPVDGLLLPVKLDSGPGKQTPSDSGRDRKSETSRAEPPISAHAFKLGELADLADYMCALVGEKRKEQPVGRAGGNLSEDGEHVRVASADGDGAAELLEGGCENAGKAGGVRVAIVNGSHAAQTALVVSKIGYRLYLAEIVVGGPVNNQDGSWAPPCR